SGADTGSDQAPLTTTEEVYKTVEPGRPWPGRVSEGHGFQPCRSAASIPPALAAEVFILLSRRNSSTYQRIAIMAALPPLRKRVLEVVIRRIEPWSGSVHQTPPLRNTRL